MKAWIDVLTPKQVFFAFELEKEFLRRGHSVIISSRRYEQVLKTLQMKRMDAHVIGEHGGRSLYGKLIASTKRENSLISFVMKQKPDCALSFLSPEAARLSFNLGLPHFGISDSPHAEAVARLTVPLLNLLFTPWVIPKKRWAVYGINMKRIIQYRALDPFIWLKNFKPSIEVLKKLDLKKDELIIVSRLEEAFAAYLLKISTNKKSLVYPVLKKLMVQYPEAKFVVLPRYGEQADMAKKVLGGKAIVPDEIIDGPSLLAFSTLFFGSGGTMTQEAALLGVPSISCFPGETLDVDRYFLIPKRLVQRAPTSEKALATARKILGEIEQYKQMQRKRAMEIISKMENPIKIIVDRLEKSIEN